MYIFRLFSVLIIISLPAQALAEEACKPIASIFGQDVCAKEILPGKALEDNIRDYARKSKQNPHQAVRDFKVSSLFGLLWETALIRKYGEDEIIPSKREVKSYLKAFHKTIRKQNDLNKKTDDLIEELLAQNQYTPENSKLLNELAAHKQKEIMMYNMREAFPDAMREKMEQGEYQMAESMVKSWKIKKALYEEYGGKVVAQQAGLEPLEAFQAFVKEIKENKEIIIHDPAYKSVFKSMDEYAAMKHTVLENDNPEIEDYFDDPAWMYDTDNARDVFEQQKAELLALPTLEPAAGEEEEEEEKPEFDENEL